MRDQDYIRAQQTLEGFARNYADQGAGLPPGASGPGGIPNWLIFGVASVLLVVLLLLTIQVITTPANDAVQAAATPSPTATEAGVAEAAATPVVVAPTPIPGTPVETLADVTAWFSPNGGDAALVMAGTELSAVGRHSDYPALILVASPFWETPLWIPIEATRMDGQQLQALPDVRPVPTPVPPPPVVVQPAAPVVVQPEPTGAPVWPTPTNVGATPFPLFDPRP